MGIIDRINSSKDIKKLGYAELTMLSDEIRDFLVDKLSKSGGHLASNLGTVELTLAINRVYDPEVDRILFDVGHQSYTHKIITGRRDLFDSLRSFNGLAGFPRPYESNADAFTAGHSSDAISVALGMAKARSLLNKVYDICVVLGDGSLSGGLAYEFKIYSLEPSKNPLNIDGCDAILFTSSKSFKEAILPKIDGLIYMAIGEITAETMRNAGCNPAIVGDGSLKGTLDLLNHKLPKLPFLGK